MTFFCQKRECSIKGKNLPTSENVRCWTSPYIS